MSHEIDRTRSNRITRAVERMFRIYGHDFNRAFESLDLAKMTLDAGSVAQSATAARYAAICLRDAAIENDRGREPESIVEEIVTIFPPDRRLNWQGNVVFSVDCIDEIRTRLSCSSERAIELLKYVTDTRAPEIESGPVGLEEGNRIRTGLESGTTDS